jgi:pyruvate ferredoxin oxidoreductase alpha subunit
MESMATNGDSAIALAWKQIDPDVVAAYPITPQTIIVERFSDFVADGEVTTEFVCSESEHSAMSICIGSAAAGARTTTATASAGLALMWEMLGVASGMRSPLTMAVANRALSSPLNIHCDHSDSMGARDLGWIQLYSENVQEAYDNAIIAIRIAEDMRVRLPVMFCLDGFILTHSIEKLDPIDTELVRGYIGEYNAVFPLLDVENPVTHGAMDLQDYFFEHKYQLIDAMERSIPVIEEAFAEFEKISGRSYSIAEPYMLDDAEYVAIALGSTAGTIQATVDELRAEGLKVGSIKLKLFRPFPEEALAKLLEGKKGVAVLERAISLGSSGPMFPEVVSAVADLEERPKAYNFIYGLGGRDVQPDDLKSIFRDMISGAAEKVNYLGVRI